MTNLPALVLMNNCLLGFRVRYTSLTSNVSRRGTATLASDTAFQAKLDGGVSKMILLDTIVGNLADIGAI